MRDLLDRHRWVPWAAPFALFIVLTELQQHVAGGVAWIYPLKTILTALLIALLWRRVRPEGAWRPGAATLTGLVVLVVWIAPDNLYPHLFTGEVFDPFAQFSRGAAIAWIAVRLAGAALLVPVVEEVFWRGFIIRWLVKPDFESVPPGTFTWYSFAATSVLFASEHDRWLVGLAAGVAYNLLWYRTRSLRACVLAHGVTNLGLGAWVLATAQWKFW